MNRQPLCARNVALVLATALALPLSAWADGKHGANNAQTQTQTQAAATTDMADGEVRKVDKEGGKLTLRHAEIKSLDMPAMTMVFVVRDKAMLDMVKAGDKVKFKAVNEAGKYMVTELQVVK